MLVIKTPDNYLKERKYLIDTIFNEFLDVQYSHKIDNELTNPRPNSSN